jgi:hypothetical protein
MFIFALQLCHDFPCDHLGGAIIGANHQAGFLKIQGFALLHDFFQSLPAIRSL